jgi:hypothetical protein
MFYQNLYHRKLFLGELFSQELILANTWTSCTGLDSGMYLKIEKK